MFDQLREIVRGSNIVVCDYAEAVAWVGSQLCRRHKYTSPRFVCALRALLYSLFDNQGPRASETTHPYLLRTICIR